MNTNVSYEVEQNYNFFLLSQSLVNYKLQEGIQFIITNVQATVVKYTFHKIYIQLLIKG